VTLRALKFCVLLQDLPKRRQSDNRKHRALIVSGRLLHLEVIRHMFVGLPDATKEIVA
jgi:hypothetical protein